MALSVRTLTCVDTQKHALEAVLETDGQPYHAFALILFRQIDVGSKHDNLTFERIVLLVDKPCQLSQLFWRSDDNRIEQSSIAIYFERLVTVVIPRRTVERYRCLSTRCKQQCQETQHPFIHHCFHLNNLLYSLVLELEHLATSTKYIDAMLVKGDKERRG